MDRKELKKKAKVTLKNHYLLLVFTCFLIAMLSLEHTSSVSSIKSAVGGHQHFAMEGGLEEIDEPMEAGDTQSTFEKVYDLVINGDFDGGEEVALADMDGWAKTSKQLGDVSVGYSKGVFAGLITNAASGEVIVLLAKSITNIVDSKVFAIWILVFLSAIFLFLVRFFFFGSIHIAAKRIALEGRVYEKVPFKRFAFAFRVRKGFNVGLTMMLTAIYMVLWSFTVVGGIIKKYSYFMVPYIIAENPGLKPNEAIKLSRRMMNGHKWECFKLNFSFVGWWLLDYVTLGLVGIFYANPYQEATFAEYYSYVRGLAKDNDIEGAKKLSDVYLFEKASDDLLKETYKEELVIPAYVAKDIKLNPVKAFIRNTFGIYLFYDEAEKDYEARVLHEEKETNVKNIVSGKQYPGKLYIVREIEKVKPIDEVTSRRHYSVASMILMFFTLCFIGWLWEVSLHLVHDGRFVNRGMLHGPWLPIYGSGGVLILLLLNRLRGHKVMHFVSTVLVCGLVEYFAGYAMELAHDGQKWWDYSGYFININGRVCAEGLTVFALGGSAIVFLLAPVLDNYFKKIPQKIVIPLCLVLLITFGLDLGYSHYNPNVGEGISTKAYEIMEARL